MSKNTIFPDTTSFTQTTATELKNIVDSHLLSLGINTVKVGSDKEILNDLDLQVELGNISKVLNVTGDKETRIALQEYFTTLGYQTKRNGINVFVRVPLKGTAHQVDLEVLHNVAVISRYHQHKIPKGSPFKGVSKLILIGTLAKDMGFMLSPWEGLYIRTADNKKGALYATDWDDIAAILLGPNASGNDMDCVENILAVLPHEQGQELLDRCRKDKVWYEDISQILA